MRNSEATGRMILISSTWLVAIISSGFGLLPETVFTVSIITSSSTKRRAVISMSAAWEIVREVTCLRACISSSRPLTVVAGLGLGEALTLADGLMLALVE